MYNFSKEQVDAIVESINKMLEKTRESMQTIDQLCDKDYLKGREKYPISAIVYTGFDSEKQNIPGFIIQKIQYGKGRFMPELYNRDAIIQFYSVTADPFGSNEVKNKIIANGNRFQIIQFEVTNDVYQLQSLVQLSFDGFTNKGRANVGTSLELFPTFQQSNCQ